MFERPRSGERAILVGVGIGHPVDPHDTSEFKALAASAGVLGVGLVLASRSRPDPKYFVGSGKAEEIKSCAEAVEADLVLVDQALTPSQERNLEKLTNRRVLDRNGLILDIFAQRARSFEGKLQVELAQLSHLATRLVRGWTHLERQKGGIGLRGPGETQLETDRRLIAKRIRTLKARLEKLARQRDTSRHVRREVPVPTVALVGYTNAGKSTLFNALTGASTYVADQLFATLDPTVRQLKLAGVGDVVLADTVGFVRALPHELVAAFRSTLQEARDADLLLHVVDASDPLRHERIAQVREVLASIGAGDIRELLVFNKLDLVADAPDAAASISDGAPDNAAAESRSAGVPRVVTGSDGVDVVADAPDAAASISVGAPDGAASISVGAPDTAASISVGMPDNAAADSGSAGVPRVVTGSDGVDVVADAPDAAASISVGAQDTAASISVGAPDTAALISVGAPDNAAADSRSAGVPRVVTGSDGVATQAWVSAVTGAGLAELRAALPYAVRPNQRRCTLHLGLPAAAVRSDLYRRNAVRSERQCDDGSWELDVELDSGELTKLLGDPGVNLVADAAVSREQRVA